MFYNRAKDLYDAHYEQQAYSASGGISHEFLESRPPLEKDTRHWLRVAISLARTKAMHRSLLKDGPDELKL